MSAPDPRARLPKIDYDEPKVPLRATAVVDPLPEQVARTLESLAFPITFKLSRPLTFHELVVLPTLLPRHRYQGLGDKIKVWNTTFTRADKSLKRIQKNLTKIERAGKDRREAEREEFQRRRQLAREISHRLGRL